MASDVRPEILVRAVEQAYNAVVITTADLDPPGPSIVYVNQAFRAMTGYTEEELLGATPRILQGPRTDREVMTRLRRQLAAGEDFTGTVINYRKDGTPYLVEWNITPVRDNSGTVAYYVSVQRDITARAEAEHFSQTLLNSLGEGVFGIDAEGRFTLVNPAALNLLGYEAEDELLGRNSHRLTHHTDAQGRPYPESSCPIYQVMHTAEPLEAWQDWFWRRDGSAFPVEVYATPLWRELGTVFGGVVVFRDISEQKRLEAELEHEAHHDRLTGLYNRRFFDELLEKAIRGTERSGEPLALMMLDIDHFKAVNDTHGHLVGDEILQTLSSVLRERLRESDTLARWGGEELMALLPATDQAGAYRLAENVREAVAARGWPGPGTITISLGVAEYRPGEAVKDFTKRVDDALYTAKENGRNRVVAAA